MGLAGGKTEREENKGVGWTNIIVAGFIIALFPGRHTTPLVVEDRTVIEVAEVRAGSQDGFAVVANVLHHWIVLQIKHTEGRARSDYFQHLHVVDFVRLDVEGLELGQLQHVPDVVGGG